MGFSATTTIDRTTWGMDKYAPMIGTDVKVMIEGEFFKTDE
jgi:polyisoprenoid-binding protein YceI